MGTWHDSLLKSGTEFKIRCAVFLVAGICLMLFTEPAMSDKFVASSTFHLTLSTLQPGRILATGQASIADEGGMAQIGGLGFYCAIPEPYIDIYVHKPKTSFLEDQYYWGTPTFTTTLTINGATIPASIEAGVIVVDIKPSLRAVWSAAFDLGPKSDREKMLHFDVANFAQFDLLLAPAAAFSPVQDAAIVEYSGMMKICDAFVAQEMGGRKIRR